MIRTFVILLCCLTGARGAVQVPEGIDRLQHKIDQLQAELNQIKDTLQDQDPSLQLPLSQEEPAALNSLDEYNHTSQSLEPWEIETNLSHPASSVVQRDENGTAQLDATPDDAVLSGLADNAGEEEPLNLFPGPEEIRESSAPEEIEVSGAAPFKDAQEALIHAQSLIQAGDLTTATQVLIAVPAQEAPPATAMLIHYWMGELHWKRADYGQAALNFATAAEAVLQLLESGEDSAKGPEIFLKLSQSLQKMGKKKEARVTIAQAEKSFPQMPAQMQDRLTVLKQTLS